METASVCLEYVWVKRVHLPALPGQSRDEFIEGILKDKFPSSRLEMNAVADKFDSICWLLLK